MIFFVKVLNKYKEFLSNNLDLADKYGLYVTGQIIKSESGGIIKEVQKVEDITKKLCDMISQEDISEERLIFIFHYVIFCGEDISKKFVVFCL